MDSCSTVAEKTKEASGIRNTVKNKKAKNKNKKKAKQNLWPRQLIKEPYLKVPGMVPRTQ